MARKNLNLANSPKPPLQMVSMPSQQYPNRVVVVVDDDILNSPAIKNINVKAIPPRTADIKTKIDAFKKKNTEIDGNTKIQIINEPTFVADIKVKVPGLDHTQTVIQQLQIPDIDDFDNRIKWYFNSWKDKPYSVVAEDFKPLVVEFHENEIKILNENSYSLVKIFYKLSSDNDLWINLNKDGEKWILSNKGRYDFKIIPYISVNNTLLEIPNMGNIYRNIDILKNLDEMQLPLYQFIDTNKIRIQFNDIDFIDLIDVYNDKKELVATIEEPEEFEIITITKLQKVKFLRFKMYTLTPHPEGKVKTFVKDMYMDISNYPYVPNYITNWTAEIDENVNVNITIPINDTIFVPDYDFLERFDSVTNSNYTPSHTNNRDTDLKIMKLNISRVSNGLETSYGSFCITPKSKNNSIGWYHNEYQNFVIESFDDNVLKFKWYDSKAFLDSLNLSYPDGDADTQYIFRLEYYNITFYDLLNKANLNYYDFNIYKRTSPLFLYKNIFIHSDTTKSYLEFNSRSSLSQMVTLNAYTTESAKDPSTFDETNSFEISIRSCYDWKLIDKVYTYFNFEYMNIKLKNIANYNREMDKVKVTIKAGTTIRPITVYNFYDLNSVINIAKFHDFDKLYQQEGKVIIEFEDVKGNLKSVTYNNWNILPEDPNGNSLLGEPKMTGPISGIDGLRTSPFDISSNSRGFLNKGFAKDTTINSSTLQLEGKYRPELDYNNDISVNVNSKSKIIKPNFSIPVDYSGMIMKNLFK